MALDDLVSIADVGFGVSQTLPVVVALRAARPGQLVYIEQPEIHLHPRAQVAMARLLVNAAKRGVRVVAETHSSLILLAVQTLVAEGVIEPDLVGLNWFLRNEKNGTTRIESAELDEAGRFGDWPEDFDEVALKTENRYLSAAEARLAGSDPRGQGPSGVLVIDASIARAAGDTSNHPTAQNCREFLQAVLSICHRMVLTTPIQEEWNKHQSRFARTWRKSMMARRKVEIVAVTAHQSLEKRINRVELDEFVAAIIEKDRHLIEAALATDKRVASLDDRVRQHLRDHAATLSEIQSICWVNPNIPTEASIAWLESGAPVENSRKLGHTPPRSKK